MDPMPLERAWRLLGRSLAEISARVAALPRDKRLEALRGEVNEAKRLARDLMVKHHPDRGGDPAKFKLAGDALASVEHHTEEFARKAVERAKAEEERAERRGPVIKIG